LSTPTAKPIARMAGAVMFLILISRLLGLVRERAVAVVFGQNWQTDAFTAAFGIPDLMFFLLVGGGLNAAFIPVFTSYLAKGEEEEGWRVAWTFFFLGTLFLLAFTILGMVFAPYLAPLVAHGFVGRQRMLLIDLMRVMFPAVFFTAAAGLGMGIHKSYRSFTMPLLGPIFYNAAIIAGTYGLARYYGIMGMAAGTVIGAAGNCLIQLPFFIRKSRPFRFIIDIKHPGIKRIFYLMGPAVVSGSIVQLNMIITRNLASALPEGSIRALQTANTLVQFPLGVFAMGIGMIILPTLSGLAAKGESDDFRRTFSEGLRLVLFITIPAAGGLAVLRVPLIRLLFEAGEFTAADTAQAAYALLFYSLGIISQAAVQILVQVYYSLQDTRTLVRVSGTAIFLNTTLSLIFLRFTPLAHGGLALAYSLTSMINMLSYLFQLRRHIGHIDGRRLVRSSCLSLLATTIMGCAVLFTNKLLTYLWQIAGLGWGWGWRLTEVIIGVGCGVIAYILAAYLLRMEEVHFIRQIFSRSPRLSEDSASDLS